MAPPLNWNLHVLSKAVAAAVIVFNPSERAVELPANPLPLNSFYICDNLHLLLEEIKFSRFEHFE